MDAFITCTLQEAWLLAELSTLQSELARLNQELVGRHRAEAALQDQWRRWAPAPPM